MKTALTSDLHIQMTGEERVREAFECLKSERPDILVIAGDQNGGDNGAEGCRAVFSLARECYRGPILACLGNHDHWTRGERSRNPSLLQWVRNFDEIVKCTRQLDIHLFEHDGLFVFNSTTVFAGHGLWYAQSPNTRDSDYLPIGLGGDTHRHLYKCSRDELLEQLEDLTDDHIMRIFVSHFPVVELDEKTKGPGDASLGGHLRELGFTKFLNGHTHGNLNGPLRYECGSHYYLPKVKMVEI